MLLYRCYVSPVDSRWRLTIRGRKYGSCTTQRQAIAVAIDAAEYAVSRGNAAEDLVTDNRCTMRPVWSMPPEHQLPAHLGPGMQRGAAVETIDRLNRGVLVLPELMPGRGP